MTLISKGSKELHQKIHNILLNDWDPIGIKNWAEAEDEYDNYVPSIAYLVRSKKSAKEIFQCLLEIERDYMGLSPSEDSDLRLTKVARQLHTLSKKEE